MKRQFTKHFGRLTVSAVTALGVAACGAGRTESDGTDDAERGGGGSVTIWTDSVELFFEYPPMVADQPGEPWAIHLTELRTFRPVTQGSLTLRFSGPDGGDREHVTVADSPVRDGIFTPAPSLPAAGTYELVMELRSAQVTDDIVVGQIVTYGSEDELPDPPEEDGSGIPFLKEQQWVIPFATVAAASREIPRSVLATGEVTPVAGRFAEVTAPANGLLLAESNRSAPVLGQWVRAGETLAVLSPVSGENSYAVQRGRAERLTREVARAERLFAAHAIPARRLEEARHDLQVAQAALQAMGTAADDGYQLALRAPISGVVSERRIAVGAHVSPGEILFTIVDPRSVWLRLNLPAVHAAEASLATSAAFTVEGSDRLYHAPRVVSVGSVIDPDRRTLPVVLEVPNGDQSLKIGMLAEGRLLMGDPATGVAVPSAAIRDEDRLTVAYVQIGGELFERRILTLGPSDGEWTIVVEGIREGERVVTLGAYQVRLGSLNTSDIADQGHPH